MTRVIPFLTRTRGGADRADRFGVQDFLAYAYLVVGVLIILIPVLWTVLTSIKSERAVENFDTRLLHYDQVSADIPGQGPKDLWT